MPNLPVLIIDTSKRMMTARTLLSTQFNDADTQNLNLDEVTENSCFTENFKQLLSSFENTNLQHLSLCPGSLPKDYHLLASELVELVEEKKLSFVISMPPPFQNSKIQQKIDQLTSNFQRQKNIAAFQRKFFCSALKNNPSSTIKRTRPRTYGLSLHIDTNLQSEQTQTKQNETTLEIALDHQVSNQASMTSQATPFSNLINREEFILLCLGESTLSQEKYLLSKPEAENLWNSLFSYQTVWKIIDSSIREKTPITLQACEQILRHWPQFQFGMEFNQLAPGFSLKLFNIFPQILDFEPAKNDSTDKNQLCIHCYSPPKLQTLSHQLLETYIEHIKKDQGNLHKLPLLLWYKLNAQNNLYDRELVDLFRQHLLVLTSLPNETTIFNKLFFKKEEFQKKGFDFLFSNFRRIAELFPDNTCLVDPGKQAAKKNLEEYFPGVLTSQAIALSKKCVILLEQPPKKLKQNILYILLEKEANTTELLYQLTNWHNELSFSRANLNALVQVYEIYGSHGLEKLFALWQQWHDIKINSLPIEISLLKLLHQICFKNFQSYTRLLDSNYADAIELIKGFYLETKQGHYWETLLRQHYAAVPEDDLPSLVNTFKAFTMQIKDFGLTFNHFPCQLKNTKSLPVTLSRILELLKNCRPEDRIKQWDCHDQLSFAPNGVMKALCKNKLFVVPEMQIDSDSAAISYVPDTREYFLAFNPKGPILGNFFRFIASQNYALSLEFYQQARQAIISKKFSKKLSANLYRCLAATTTGSTNSLFITDTNQALAKWKKLLETIPNIIDQIEKRIPLPIRKFIRKSEFEEKINLIITTCLNKEGSFPLPIFLKLMESALNAISDKEKSFADLENLFNEIIKVFEYLNLCVNRYGDVIYRGMRFYDAEYFKNTADATFLFQYYKVIHTILSVELDEYHYLTSDIIPLISTFQLQSQDIPQIFKLIEEIKEAQLASSGKYSPSYLSLLDIFLITNKTIDKNGVENKLVCANFINYLTNFKKDFDNIIPYIKNVFKNYCDINGLIALEKKQLSNQLKENIKNEFSEIADQHIITRFLTLLADDATRPEKNFQIILALCKTLKKIEQKDFLQCLQQLNKIDISNIAKNLTGILVKIYEKQYVHDFIYFIKKNQQKNGNNNENLVERLQHYLEIRDKVSTINNQQLSVLIERLLLFPTERTELTVLHDLISKFDILLGYDSSYAAALFDFLNNFISELEDAQKPIISRIAQFTTNLDQLAREASVSLDLKFTLANLFYYSKKTPFKLDQWLEVINQKVSKPAYKTFLLQMLSILLSQALQFDGNHFSTLITLLQGQDIPEKLFTALLNSYQRPPYPPLAKLLQWWDEAEANSDANLLNQRYHEFIVMPYPRQALNGFHLKFAKKQKELFKGVIFSEEELLQLTSEVNSARSASPEEILCGLKTIKKTTENLDFQDLVKLVANLTELLYRSKGIEINTTQYLAIIAMLLSNGHVSSEIATGEGKSRIMMILAASQAFLGKTCDFVTSNMQLAQRDYIEYLPFFNLAGIRAQLISATSSFTNYQHNAIHFTDMTNLSLFRNKARTHQQLDTVLNPNKNERSLLLDEADRSYFDLAQTRFNYSDSSSNDIEDMEWIYPLLIEFILLPEYEDLFYNDIQAHTENFISFAKTKINVAEIQRLDSLTNVQLETWLESAMNAKKLKFKEHFIIKPDVDISSPQGPQIASMAYVIHNNRLCTESQYSEGVHQCLHALLEMQRRRKIVNADPALAEILSQCKTSFYINTEKRIICSTNSYDLLTDYQDGNLIGVSGTLGCQVEKQEAAFLYQKKGLETMQFIKVPRHQPLKRLDKPCRLAANFQRQASLLLDYIQKAYAKNQAVLLISENESRSTQLQQTIAELNQNLPEAHRLPKENFQSVSSELSSEQEKQRINRAGEAGMITFSTAMLGRGTDIELKGRAKEEGLLVLLSYLPDERDYRQIIGRSGRYGAKGESRIVIEKENINANYYLNSDAWQQKEWQKRNRKSRFQRLIGFLLGNTFTNYQNKFSFNTSYRVNWLNFIHKVPELYKKAYEKIAELFKKPKLTWSEFMKKLKIELGIYKDNFNNCFNNDVGFLTNHLPESLLCTEEDESIIKLLEKSIEKKSLPEHQTSNLIKLHTHTTYDPALDGRSKVYSKFFLETRAFFAGKRSFLANCRAAVRGEGIFWADTRALLAGKRPFFANTRASCNPKFFFQPEQANSFTLNIPRTPDIEKVRHNVR